MATNDIITYAIEDAKEEEKRGDAKTLGVGILETMCRKQGVELERYDTGSGSGSGSGFRSKRTKGGGVSEDDSDEEDEDE